MKSGQDGLIGPGDNDYGRKKSPEDMHDWNSLEAPVETKIDRLEKRIDQLQKLLTKSIDVQGQLVEQMKTLQGNIEELKYDIECLQRENKNREV